MENSFVLVHQKHLENSELNFQNLYEAYAPSLLNYVQRKICRPEFAKDVVQVIFMDLWSRRDKIPYQHIKPYLMRAAHNKCTDLIRKNAVEKKHEASIAYETLLNESSYEQDNEELILWAEKAVDDLPQRSREIFCMSKYQGLKYREIAEELGVSQKTVETHMRRAMIKLRESFENFQTCA
ncbi:RNA polymerase sigma-70 factor [Aureibacter tunicatorum]|uniref:RNA polymerase sigma-70 factor (ECF subfamily) n=1 Tax=Aureibacter tunicatorum TaxID=866807 RepID=A0AAE3XTK8_9BACT|nr:RNA polymerase sigma-70 factor [Aureibacter tunicatorum]MDR6241770.1 RNA polymerase sigma-70 factor (ECF subfamily) [Aureibacter tunicatorum]BDD07438.1 RNA polymerase sigma-70 factor [Aureibacter tunicatorum]